MQSQYKNLKVWQKAMELNTLIYKLTTEFPSHELYGLTSQVRRCSVSVASNIAEGSERSSNKDFTHFLRIAKGSIAELETQLLMAQNLGYLKNTKSLEESFDLIIEIRKMLSGLCSKLQSSTI